MNEKIKIEYGLNSIYYNFDPGLIEPTAESSPVQRRKLEDKFAFENALYWGINYQLYNKITFQAGARLSQFLRLGQKFNTYSNNNPLLYITSSRTYEEAKPIGTEIYSLSEIVTTYTNLEPRFSLAYQIAKDRSLKLSYNRMAQYLHLSLIHI